MIKDIQPYIHLNMTPIEKVKLINQVIYEIYKVKETRKIITTQKFIFWTFNPAQKGKPLTISIL